MTAALLVLPTIVAAAMLMSRADDLDWRHTFIVGAVGFVCAAIVIVGRL